MSYNRSVAKARAVQRSEDAKAHGFKVPDFSRWEPALPPRSTRCRHCGSTVTTYGSKCTTCWRPL